MDSKIEIRRLMKYRGPYRLCIHTITGKLKGKKLCLLKYDCSRCALDQMLEEKMNRAA